MSEPSKEKLYCACCGYTLKVDDRITGYDEYTGTPIKPFINDPKICTNRHCKKCPYWGNYVR